MEEKRRSIRSPISITLRISDISDHAHSVIRDLQTPIQLIDISAYGIGFVTECILPLEHYFQVTLVLSPNQPEIDTKVKIIRVDVQDSDMYLYGCEFVDLGPSDKEIIDSYAVAFHS